ncbi:uncharacterized protein [Antedon mediterranea]|uniref:uncharacterized protein n=1 Tax=Antedon mediterranea TaxID=105859 RepID=UPI003AF6649C
MEKDTRWILIILIFVSLICFCHGTYLVQAPTTHMAFSNVNISVNYTLVENSGNKSDAILELIDIDTNRSLHRNHVSSQAGVVIYPCSMFTNTSRLIVQVLDDNETTLAQSDILTVEPPFLEVVRPSTQLQTLDGPVGISLYMKFNNGLCQHNQHELLFIARYRKYNDHKSDQIEVYSQSIDYQEGHSTVTLDCEYLDTAGYYIFLVTTKSGTVLGSSDFMNVLWNPNYSVTVPSPSISECSKNQSLSVNHQAPYCGKSNDKIRVYGQTSYSAEAGPIGSLAYILEVDTPNNEYDNKIACSNFYEPGAQQAKSVPTHLGYCFFYVSVTRTGSVHEQARMCVPFYSSDIAIAGGWSEWGEWSACTASCSGGSRHRTRGCENPVPKNGGALCNGDYVKTEECNLFICPTVSGNNQLPKTYNTCGCGCLVESPSGIIDAYEKDCHSRATWIIRVNHGYRVNITFNSFDLSSSGRYQEYLRIRDGDDVDAPILLFVTGTRRPIPVVSTGDVMFLEYKIYRSNSYRHGFLATFNSTKKEGVIEATKKEHIYENPNPDQFSGNTIMMAGVITCVCVIFITVAAVTYIYIKSGLMLECIRNIKPRIKSEFSIPAEQDKCSPVHRPYKTDIPSDMDDRGNPDGKVCDRSQMYLAKEEHSNLDSNDFPRRLISIDSDDCRKDPLGQDQSFTGAINASFDDRNPDGQRNHRYSFHSDGSRSSFQIKYTMREGPSGYSRQASINSCDSSNTLPSNFQFAAPYVNREGNLTPLGFAISRSLSLCHEKDNPLVGNQDQRRSQSTCGITDILPETHLVSGKDGDRQTTPTSTQVVVHSEKTNSDTRSPTSRVPRKLPAAPRPAFYEFQMEQPDQNSPQRTVTPTRQKNSKTRRLSSNKNAVMTINEEPSESTERLDSETMSPSESVASHMSMTRESPPGGPVRRLKQKAAKRQRKSTECLSSAESDLNPMRLSFYSTSSQEYMFSDEQPSPIRKLEKKDDRHMWRQVFISDESLSKTISGGSAESSPTRRRLPETPTKRPNSFNNNQFPSNTQIIGDMVIYQEENELEFDNYMPNLPGSYFEGNFNYPAGDLGSDMDLFEGLEISKV